MNEKIATPSGQRGAESRKISLRGCLVGLAAFAALAVLSWYVLMGQAAAPQTSSSPINLRLIRQLAQASPGKLPIRLNAAVVGAGSYPQVLVIAGSGLQPRKMVFAAYQLMFEDHSMVIDSTFPEADYKGMFPGSPFDTQAYESIQRALQKSSLVLLTHTHIDHIAGITRGPDAVSLMPRVILTQEQFDSTAADIGMTAELRAQVEPIKFQDYHAAAPGVVLIKAPGHSPGDQMVYIQLQNGSEFLLTGDVVWSYENITRATGRPLLFRWIVQEDWGKNGSEIRALHDLAEGEPVHFLVSHDGPQLDEYIRQGLVGRQFE